MRIPTILVELIDDVKNVGHFIINECDFDAGKHKRVITPPPGAAPLAAPPAVPVAADPLAKLAKDWAISMDVDALRKLAGAIEGRVAETRDQAVAMIKAALDKRAAAAALPPAPPPAAA